MHPLELRLGDEELIGALKYLLGEASSHLFTEKLDTIHDVLQHGVFVLLAADKIAAQKLLDVLDHSRSGGEPEALSVRLFALRD